MQRKNTLSNLSTQGPCFNHLEIACDQRVIHSNHLHKRSPLEA